MASFNTKQFAWIDVNVVLLGKPVTELRGIEYKSKRSKEALFATGKKARGIQMGKKEYEGTITVLQYQGRRPLFGARAAFHRVRRGIQCCVTI